jgi:hypothetical protein
MIPIIVLTIFEIKYYLKKMDESNFIIRQPVSYFGTGILCIIITCAGILFTRTYDLKSILITLISFVIGVILLIYCLRWKLTIEDNQIIITPFIGKNKIIDIKDITKIKIGKIGNDLTVYNNKKVLFIIDYTCRGYELLVSRLRSENIQFE